MREEKKLMEYFDKKWLRFEITMISIGLIGDVIAGVLEDETGSIWAVFCIVYGIIAFICSYCSAIGKKDWQDEKNRITDQTVEEITKILKNGGFIKVNGYYFKLNNDTLEYSNNRLINELRERLENRFGQTAIIHKSANDCCTVEFSDLRYDGLFDPIRILVAFNKFSDVYFRKTDNNTVQFLKLYGKKKCNVAFNIVEEIKDDLNGSLYKYLLNKIPEREFKE